MWGGNRVIFSIKKATRRENILRPKQMDLEPLILSFNGKKTWLSLPLHKRKSKVSPTDYHCHTQHSVGQWWTLINTPTHATHQPLITWAHSVCRFSYSQLKEASDQDQQTLPSKSYPSFLQMWWTGALLEMSLVYKNCSPQKSCWQNAVLFWSNNCFSI